MVCEVHPDLVPALAARPLQVLGARDYLVVLDSEETVRAVRPDFGRPSQLDRFAVIITASGRDCDFVSRFFAPGQGVPEDPVTGSAHCTLAPYWSKKLNKASLFAKQVSSRGGELWCEDRGDRVAISGNAVLVVKGEILA
jgi:predicted PhzF superfamily epimerase YddE/YHI9